MQLNDKIALVTAGGRGIGQGIALALAKAGADIASMVDNLEDQRAFQQLTLDMLRHLDLTLPEDADDAGDDTGDDEGEAPEEDETGEDEQDEGDSEPQSSEIAGEPAQGERHQRREPLPP